MTYIKGENRGQITMLPDCIDDLIGQDNPVRVINAFIDGLDMDEACFKRSAPNVTGRPSYDPRDLLKLYVYGYFNKIRSSRKLMTECSRNIELFFLLNRLTPDFRTISDFRKDSAKQTAVDKGSHLIAEYEVTNCCTDQGLLKEVSEKTREMLEVETLEIVADKGYESRKDIENCVMNGIIPNVAFKYDREERLYSIDYVEADKGANSIYANKDACRQCPNRCTGSRKYKTVSFGPETKCIPVRMYGNVKCSLNPIPDNIPVNPFNHTLDRKDYSPRKVVLRIKGDDKKIRERMCLSEHPFGTVKWHHGAHYLLCKGKEKATAELGLSFLAYNLKRAINMVGVKGILAVL